MNKMNTINEKTIEIEIDMKKYLDNFYTTVDAFRMMNENVFRELQVKNKTDNPKKTELKQLLSNIIVTSDQLNILLDAINACQND